MSTPALIPPSERLFICEYVQLHGVEDQGPGAESDARPARALLGEGPVVLGRLAGVPVIQIGMPENMMTWQLTSDLPCLKASSTAYMFAVPYSQQFYILEFMPEFPAAQLAVLEGCLQQFCAYAVSQEVPQVSTIPGGEHVTSADGTMFTTDPTLARYIRSTGSMVASGVLTAGDYFSKGIVQAGEWYRARYPERKEDVQMSSTTMSGIETAKKTTGTVAKYTSIAADALGSAIGSVANSAASRMKQKGVAKEGSSTRKAAKVGKAGIVAVVEVFDSMHDAGRQVLASGSTETATCVQYRYGDQAAKAAEQGMGMAVDAYDVYGAYKQTRAKALAAAFAKGAVSSGSKPYPDDASVEPGAADAAAPGTSTAAAVQQPEQSTTPAAESVYPPMPAPPGPP